MRVGIISDIHSSLTALEAVLQRLDGVDEFICPGDVVGYGPDPNECCAKIRSLDCVTVLGNHDAAVADRMDMSWFNRDALSAASWTREARDEPSLNQLEALSVVHPADEFLLVHGSLQEPTRFTYVYSPSAARPCFEEMRDHSICFIGHTHISEVFVQRMGELGADQLQFPQGGKLDLKPGFRYIVNCGSVGQPRDGNPEASCGIYDTEAANVEIIRVSYDIHAVQQRMRAAGLPESLAVRLEYGQ